MSELVGYARVSTLDQDYSLQVEQLKMYGCTKIFHEKKSGKNTGLEIQIMEDGSVHIVHS